jgi:hypothetical protein
LKIRLTLTQTIEDDPLGLLPGLPESPLRLSAPKNGFGDTFWSQRLLGVSTSMTIADTGFTRGQCNLLPIDIRVYIITSSDAPFVATDRSWYQFCMSMYIYVGVGGALGQN